MSGTVPLKSHYKVYKGKSMFNLLQKVKREVNKRLKNTKLEQKINKCNRAYNEF